MKFIKSTLYILREFYCPSRTAHWCASRGNSLCLCMANKQIIIIALPIRLKIYCVCSFQWNSIGIFFYRDLQNQNACNAYTHKDRKSFFHDNVKMYPKRERERERCGMWLRVCLCIEMIADGCDNIASKCIQIGFLRTAVSD